MKRSVIGMIAVRGGSKRLPNKNIKPLCGKPLIAWTIEAAREVKDFDRVIVSTDSEQIASIAIEHGADVPGLRQNAFDDYAPVSLSTVSLLEEYPLKHDIVVQLQPVHPLRTSTDIEKALNWFISGIHEFQLTAERIPSHLAWWACKLNSRGESDFLFPIFLQDRTQDLPDLFTPNGAVMIANYEALMKSKTFYGQGFLMYRLSKESCYDIDELYDFEFAEMIMNRRIRN